MLALSEYLMKEPLPLATLHDAIFDFCRGRTDLCVFGSQAVSQHSAVPRMTQDVNIMAEEPDKVSRELARCLSARFAHRLAVRVRVVRRDGRVLGYRIYQRRSARQDAVDALRLMVARPELRASDLLPLWSALGAPATAADTFDKLRAEARPSTDADDFY